MERKSAWLKYDSAALKRIHDFAALYRIFLDKGKTERECVKNAVQLAREAGFSEFHEYMAANGTLKPGAKIYFVNMNKALALYYIGDAQLAEGLNIVAAHIDSPRLDIKQNPLYEVAGMAYLDTHYYGGLKKYQWTARPLALHGTIVRKDGTAIDINIGETDDEPVFCITDLLIHLADKQLKQNISEAVTGENLDILVGSCPLPDETKGAVKKRILELLAEKYKIAESDFVSAELEIVPAGRARVMGLDESMILAYGQDDRACAFAAVKAILSLVKPQKTACCILTDKEEIGSVGATGMQAAFFANTIAEIAAATGCKSGLAARRILTKSRALSADVGAAFDSLYSDVFDEKNTSKLGYGPLIKKFTGARGKSGANDANAEYLAVVRSVMAAANVSCQTMETGKVDAGGGGTIAYILAGYGMEVVDLGIPILNMHAPWEVTSAVDIYEAKKAYAAFWQYC